MFVIAPRNHKCVTNVYIDSVLVCVFLHVYTCQVAFDSTDLMQVCVHVRTILHVCPVNRKCTVCSWSLVPSSSACEDPLCTDLLRKSLQFEISRKDIRREIIASLATLVSLERSLKTRHYDTMQLATSSRTHNFC